MPPELDPQYVDDNEDLDSVVDSVGDPEYNPETPEVHELEDDDDDDGDDHASPKMPPSKIYTKREEARSRRNKRKLDVEATVLRVQKLTESKMAKESRSPSASRGQSTSKSRSPPPSTPGTPLSQGSGDDDYSPRPQASTGSGRKKTCFV